MVLGGGPFPCGRTVVYAAGDRLFLDKDAARVAAGAEPVLEFAQLRGSSELVPAFHHDADGSETSIVDDWHATDRALCAARFPDPRLRFDRYGDLQGFDGDQAAFHAFRARVLTSGHAHQGVLSAIRRVSAKLAYDEECRARSVG